LLRFVSRNRCWQLKHKSQELMAKSQWLLFSHSRDLSNGECLAREIHPFQGHTSSPLEAAEAGTPTMGHSPQRCRPFLGFPPASQTLTLAAVPPAPLPSEHSVEYTKATFQVNQNLHFSDQKIRNALHTRQVSGHGFQLPAVP
jgi:hypothetical protein